MDPRRQLFPVRRALAFLFLGWSGLGLAACGGAEPEAPATASPAASEPPTATLADWLPAALEDAAVPGVALAVIEEGEVAWQETFGVAWDGPTGKVELEGTAVFEAASLSKPVFTFAVLRLEEQGELDLDVPLVTYLPEAGRALEGGPYPVDDARFRRITARQVLSHTTGFPNWRGDRPLGFLFDPGDRFGYSGEGYVFLQRVVEEVTGEPLNDVVRRLVFEPVGMARSSYIWRQDYEGRHAMGHDFLGQPASKNKPEEANAAATLHTTAGDFARFVVAILDPARFDPPLLATESIDTMAEPQVAVEKGISWGLGWGLEKMSDGDTRLWHWGDNGVFRAYVVASRERRSGLVFFANGENGYTLTEELVSQVLGDEEPGPALRWRGWERHDSSALGLRLALARAGLESPERLAEVYDEHWEKDPQAFDESLINRTGYDLLRLRASAAAVELLRRNAEAYPDSWNAHDSLGEAYFRAGQKEPAIASYEKSLELEPGNDNAEKMLQEIRAQGKG